MVPEGLLMARLPKILPGNSRARMEQYARSQRRRKQNSLRCRIAFFTPCKSRFPRSSGNRQQQSSGHGAKALRKEATTYPATDCRYLPVEQYQEAENVLSEALSSFAGLEKIAGKCPCGTQKLCMEYKKVTAHHAIAPTGEKPDGLSGGNLTCSR